MENVVKEFDSLDLSETVVTITLEGVNKHFSIEKIKFLDRIARFQPYGYTTT